MRILEDGTLKSKLADALEGIENKIALHGIEPDDVVHQFLHNSLVSVADKRQAAMRIFSSNFFKDSALHSVLDSEDSLTIIR